MKRAVIGKAIRLRVIERDRGCAKCGRADGLEMHHINPVAEGGTDEEVNLQALCGACHAELSWIWVNKPPIPYEDWLKLRPAHAVMSFLLMAEAGLDLGIGITAEQAAKLLRRPA